MFTRSTRWLPGRFPRMLVAGLALLLAWLPMASPTAAQTSNHQVPFKGKLQAFESGLFNPGPPPTVSVTAAGSGHATHLGRFAYTYTVVISFPTDTTRTGTLYYDFVAANGDHLYSVGAGFGVPVGDFDHVVEQHTITGGTGRFAGATGSFTVDRLINHATATTTGTIGGYVVLAKGK